MADILSDADVRLLDEAITLRKASSLANAVFTLENVMCFIKTLLLESADESNTQDIQSTNQQSSIEQNIDKMCSPSPTQTTSKDEKIPDDLKIETSIEPIIPQKLSTLCKKHTAVLNIKSDVRKRKRQPKQADVTVEAMFTCEKCGYQTKRKDHFHRHTVSHMDVKPFKCSLCSFSCSDQWHLNRHLKSRVHSKQEVIKDTMFTCESCDYQTTNWARMSRHRRTHSGEKPFACTYCPYKAAQRATLDRHIKTHTGEKPFKCQECDYCSADSKSLKFHRLQKHGSNDGTVHKCTQCDYSTPVLRYFQLHMRAHSDTRPYLCDMCGYSAKRPHGLTKHYRSMHGWTKNDTDGRNWARSSQAPVQQVSKAADTSTSQESEMSDLPRLTIVTASNSQTSVPSQSAPAEDNAGKMETSAMDVYLEALMPTPPKPYAENAPDGATNMEQMGYYMQ